MFENLEVFKMSSAMAQHAGAKQAIAAENVANSDTPDYRAKDIIPFSHAYENDVSRAGVLSLNATREKHLHGNVDGAFGPPIIDEAGVASPNGNTVTLESEMLRSLDAKRQHDRALAIYKSSMTILRSALSRA